ncbi:MULTISPECIES: hypothetical protein [unclassified Phyllobacterium]|uniref:hypothetical protein n=1 Tax=Phyllobacterium TaxID=28100 RepID=UPI000DDCA0EB|nr:MULTISPECIES: hypothetical protein [unclassified Phyllobacterium]MBA8901703.1 hypothetical protein [Phyllobacterium sp. P30BS-XVII]UGX88960.1 hypothetical protein LLE53_021015 [Phyllobacterium sp. T1293]
MFLRSSAWSYETGSTGGLAIGYAVGSGGKIFLHDPSGVQKSFWYGGLGGGIGEEARLGKFKAPTFKIKGSSVGAAGSLTSYPSWGKVYMTDAFKGTELAESDIRGATVYIDAAAGIVAGFSGSAMILGIDPLPLIIGLTNPLMMMYAQFAIWRAPAVLIMGGVNVGFQAGMGIGALAGYLR